MLYEWVWQNHIPCFHCLQFIVHSCCWIQISCVQLWTWRQFMELVPGSLAHSGSQWGRNKHGNIQYREYWEYKGCHRVTNLFEFGQWPMDGRGGWTQLQDFTTPNCHVTQFEMECRSEKTQRNKQFWTVLQILAFKFKWPKN